MDTKFPYTSRDGETKFLSDIGAWSSHTVLYCSVAHAEKVLPEEISIFYQGRILKPSSTLTLGEFHFIKDEYQRLYLDVQYNGDAQKTPTEGHAEDLKKINPFEFQIFAKDMTRAEGKTFTLNVSYMTSIYTVKMLLRNTCGISLHSLRLLFAGRQFDDDDALLYQIGIPSEATLHCVNRMGTRCQFSISVTDNKKSSPVVANITRYTTGKELLKNLQKETIEYQLGYCGKIIPLDDNLYDHGIGVSSIVLLTLLDEK